MQQILISSFTFEARTPYNEHHVCTAIEAAVLNSVRHENIRNNFGKKLKGMQESGASPADIAEAFRQYDLAYEFTFTPMPRKLLDPIDRASRAIAEELVLSALRKKNLAKGDLEEGQFDLRVAEVMKLPRVREEATRRVEATRDIASDALDLGGAVG